MIKQTIAMTALLCLATGVTLTGCDEPLSGGGEIVRICKGKGEPYALYKDDKGQLWAGESPFKHWSNKIDPSSADQICSK